VLKFHAYRKFPFTKFPPVTSIEFFPEKSKILIKLVNAAGGRV